MLNDLVQFYLLTLLLKLQHQGHVLDCTLVFNNTNKYALLNHETPASEKTDKKQSKVVLQPLPLSTLYFLCLQMPRCHVGSGLFLYLVFLVVLVPDGRHWHMSAALPLSVSCAILLSRLTLSNLQVSFASLSSLEKRQPVWIRMHSNTNMMYKPVCDCEDLCQSVPTLSHSHNTYNSACEVSTS